jgi:hypothetical protein
MTGHEPLISMRQKGKRPTSVTLWDTPGFDWTASPDCWAHPYIAIAPEDVPERLDLRFLVGLVVHVSADDTPRLKRLVLACEDAGATQVYGFNTRTTRAQQPEILAAFCTHGEDQSWRN